VGDLAVKEKVLMEYDTDHGKVKLSPGIVRRYLVSGKAELVSDTEIVMFMQLCRYQGLNPFLREAYLIKYSQNDPATIVTGKDTFTKRAASIKECEGYNAGVIIKTGAGLERRKGSAVLDGEALVGGWADVFRSGWKEPLHAEVSMKEYQRTKADGTPVRSWAMMPATMIRKVALVQALREAFPDKFQGLYSPEEMPVDGSKLDEKPVEPVYDVGAEVVGTTGAGVPDADIPFEAKEAK
jgi:phage recombination protein Bet